MRAGTQTTIRHKFEAENGKGEVWELIQTLVSGRVPASRILELFYWSQEPGALEMLRSFLGLSAQDSAALLRFFKQAEPSSVAITANDAVLGISTSGTAANVIRGIRRARELGALTIAFTGRDGGPLADSCEHAFVVPSWSIHRIQEVHTMLLHLLWDHTHVALGEPDVL